MIARQVEVFLDDIVEQRREGVPLCLLAIDRLLIGRLQAHHDQKAIMKPNQEKKNTRPCILITLNSGIERALPLAGFMVGAFHSTVGLKTILAGRSSSVGRLVSWDGRSKRMVLFEEP